MTSPARPRQWGSTLPQRDKPMARTSLTVVRDIGSGTPRTPIKPVSAKRPRENRARAAMADRLWPDRREGTVMCEVPWCTLPADDVHEPLTRARGGSITDEKNAKATCRGHNQELTLEPEWGYDLGFLIHSWDAPGGDAA